MKRTFLFAWAVLAVQFVLCACAPREVAVHVSSDTASSARSEAALPRSETSAPPAASGTVPASSASSSKSSRAAAPPSSPASAPSAAIPKWYVPGKLAVTAVAQGGAAPMSAAVRPRVAPLAASAHALLPADAVIGAGGAVDADFIPLSYSAQYPGGAGIYYHIKTKQVICFSAKAEPVLRAKGLIPAGGSWHVCYEDAASGNCFLGVSDRDHGAAGTYFYNIYDGRFWAFDVPYTAWPVPSFSPDKRFLSLSVERGGKEDAMVQDLYLVDLTGRSQNMKAITRLALPFILYSSYSDTGKYLYYRTGVTTEQGYQYPVQELYGIQSQGKISFQGNVVRFADHERLVIVETPAGTEVLECETGRDVTASAKLEDWQKYRVDIDSGAPKEKNGPTTGPFIPNYKVTLTPLFKGLTPKTVLGGASAVCVQDEYLYSYRDGDSFLTCTQIMSGQSFAVELDGNFIRAAANTDRSQTALLFHMYISLDKTQLLLYYSTDRARY